MPDKKKSLTSPFTLKGKPMVIGISACVIALLSPTAAFAASSVLGDVMKLLSNAVQFIGAILVIFGAVSVGLTLKDGVGGGGQISNGICLMVAGGCIAAAAKIFAS